MVDAAPNQTPERRSRMADAMSPRPLQAIRANGSNIVGGSRLGSELDAASTFKRHQEARPSEINSRAQEVTEMVDPRQFDQMDAEMSMNANLHLVPCRWSPSGWRYVQRDPKDHRFFNNANRVNNFGVASDRKRHQSSNMRQSMYKSTQRSAFNPAGTSKSRADQTTYGNSFIKGQR